MDPLHAAVRIQRLDPRAVVPEYKSALAAGMDLAALVAEGETITLEPGRIIVVRTGIAMAIPAGFEGQVRPRSGLSSRHGISCPNTPGTIDADYRGELLVPLINLGREPFAIAHGLRIAQLVIAPVVRARLEVVDALDPTARGEGGFGSTGR